MAFLKVHLNAAIPYLGTLLVDCRQDFITMTLLKSMMMLIHDFSSDIADGIF